jgi:2-amino-4-hydroxy-6-hydroxymethyldihydropteridine diphosphokinase
MATVYLGLGSNLGDKEKQITTTVRLLAERAGTILALSDYYETYPWGFRSENTFLNVALCIESSLTPFALLNTTRQIEREMGRRQTTKGVYQDRVIDIDILLFDDLILSTFELTIPHPLMHKRHFVLAPLAAIAPELVHPVLKKTISELAFVFS